MGRTKGLFAALFAVCILTVGASTVSAQRWDELGTKDVSDKAESDDIKVGVFEGQLKRLRFSTAAAPARFYLARIRYRSGETHYINLGGQLVQPGGYTRPYDFKGSDRYVNRIELFAEAAGRPGQVAKVTAWGFKEK